MLLSFFCNFASYYNWRKNFFLINNYKSMRKFFTLAIVAMISLVANAQFVKGPAVKGAAVPKTAPAKTAGIEGTDLWGYYLGNNFGEFMSLGTGAAGSFRVAIKVPGTGVLAGTKIRGINVPLLGAVTNASAWVATGLGNSTKVATKTFTGTTMGYVTVQFDEPVEIPANGLYAGYTFTSQDAYPIATVGNDTPGGLFLATSATGALVDYSAGGYGVSPIQVYVEGMVLPENGAAVTGVSCEAVAKGSAGTALVTISSDGSNGVSSLGYTLTVNGVETTGTANLSIPAGLAKTGSFSVSFTAPEEVGAFPASIAINTVNGQPNETGTAAVPFTVNTVTRVVPRMTVIEEYTGTGCGYCPRGWVGMEAVKNNQSDKALVIAWHKYNSSDAMYQANYASIPFDGAPQCTVDRKIYPDPYYGEGEEGIMECVNTYNTTVPTVDITSLKANFEDETNKKVVVSSNTEFLTNTKGYTIAFVLTADSLTGATTAWKQSNYYNTYAPESAGILPEMPELADFCRGGKYGKSSVQIVFNDALIGSSYNTSGRSLVPAFTTGQAGDVETSEYTLTMPTKTALLNALKYDKIYLTALVIDNNGQIANAKRVRVLGAGETGEDVNDDPIQIDGINISAMDEETQLMGEAMSPNAKYVVGMNYAYYAPSAWNVETDEYVDFPDYEEGAFHAANSNGILVGDNGNFAIKAEFDGGVTSLYRFEGEEIETEWGPMSTGDAGSSAYAVSEDGKTIAGFYFDSAYKTTPCIWNENNVRIDLPLPTAEEAGFEISGGEVRYMTPDGKILLGFLMDNMSTWPACIWRQNATGGYDVDVICKDYWEEGYQMGKPYMVFNPTAISANGEWVALQVQREFDDWDFSTPQPVLQAARLNLNTKALEVLEAGDEAFTPAGIANDGTMLVYTGGRDMMGRSGYIWEAGKTAASCIDAAFNSVPEMGELVSNTPCTITADGKYIQGFGLSADSNIFSYVVDYSNVSTGIENVTVTKVQKISSDKIYNLQGQQVNGMNARGLYIMGGKKVMK